MRYQLTQSSRLNLSFSMLFAQVLSQLPPLRRFHRPVWHANSATYRLIPMRLQYEVLAANPTSSVSCEIMCCWWSVASLIVFQTLCMWECLAPVTVNMTTQVTEQSNLNIHRRLLLTPTMPCHSLTSYDWVLVILATCPPPPFSWWVVCGDRVPCCF